jgi:hypothetical protein
MNPRRSFLYGFALGIMLATVSSYYHFCRPQQQTVSDLTLYNDAARSAASATPAAKAAPSP